ncbi:MAG: chorismate mutase, partial [Candidatus Omnitrophica bacterium]|nr:chorismate mutase [Candidatus Omnitrophota bacterium]
MEIKVLRNKIDRIDEKVLALLNERAKLSLKIASLKRLKGKSIYAPDRETYIIRELCKKNFGPLSKEAVESIFREIMSSSLSLEKPFKVAYLGPP